MRCLNRVLRILSVRGLIWISLQCFYDAVISTKTLSSCSFVIHTRSSSLLFIDNKTTKTSSKLHFYAECRTIFVSHRITLLSSATSDFLNRPQFRLRSVVSTASALMVSPRMNLTQISGFPQLKSRARRGVLIISLPQPGNSIKL